MSGDKYQQGLEFHQRGQLAQAEACYREALQAQPQHADALQMLAVAAYQQQRHEEAVDLFKRVLQSRPRDAGCLSNLALPLEALGRQREALASLDQAIEAAPGHAAAHCNRGNVLARLGRPQDAMRAYDRAIELQPDFASAHVARANLLQQQNELAPALAAYDRALVLEPRNADALTARGVVLQLLNRHEEALACHEAALRLKPGSATALNNRGLALKDLNRLEEAVASFDDAIRLRRDHPDAFLNRGAALRDLGRFEASAASYRRALALRPDWVDAHVGLGHTLLALRDLPGALDCYARALKLAPDHLGARWGTGFVLLTQGDLERGFRLYEARWEGALSTSKRDFGKPLWLGDEPLAGRTLLLHAEQGLGDSLQFCRYAQLCLQQGAEVVMELPKPLVRLLGASLDPRIRIVVKGEALPAFDLHTPLLSLPLAFRTTLQNIPFAEGYLRSDPALAKRWAKALGAKKLPRVGLVWSGNTGHKLDRLRSIPLTQLLPQLPDGVQYVSLQKELRAADEEALRARPDIVHFGERLGDFADTAALCAHMDMVVSVDTSVVHLAGALARPTLLLLPTFTDWRWLLDREDSPWYRSMRLLRQREAGDWAPVLAAMREALSVMAAGGGARGRARARPR